MSNIKFVFQKKVHKLPQNVNSYQLIINAIKAIYPNLNKFYLFSIVNTESDLMVEIQNDCVLQQLKLHYAKQQWPSIKLLVTEDQDYSTAAKESWGVLNQSLIITKNQDAITLAKPQIADSSQQVVPQAGSKGTQAKVQQADNGQNTLPFDYQNNQQFKEYVTKIIDERLQYYGLLQKKIQQERYTFSLQLKYPIYESIPGTTRNIDISVQNTGKTWKNAILMCQTLNQQYQLKTVESGKSVTITITVPCPQITGEKYTYEFKILCENEQNELIQVYGIIPITFKMSNKSNDDLKLEELFSLFPQKGKNFLENFIITTGKEKSVNELVEILLQQQY